MSAPVHECVHSIPLSAGSGIAFAVLETQPDRNRFSAWLSAAKTYAPALFISTLLGLYCTLEILSRASEPAAPLDDAFIHFQYARRLAEGSFFSYTKGAGYTSGATSFLWPLLLAPFYKLGFRGLSIIPISWCFGTLAHAALAVETFRLANRLAGRATAYGAAAMSLGFGAFAWFAWSGMETIPFAWMLARTTRLCAEWCDGDPPAGHSSQGQGTHTARRLAGVCAFGLLTPLMRPEGALASLMAAAAIASVPPVFKRGGSSRLFALIPLSGPLIVPLTHFAMTGHSSSSTAMVKWFFLNPAYDTNTKIAQLLANIDLFARDLLNGGDYTTIFIPFGLTLVVLLGMAALPSLAHRQRAPFHAFFVSLFALGALIPCSYMSLLWNRVRYTWPFAPAFFVLLACFAQKSADLFARRRPMLRPLAPIIAGLFAGAFISRLPWSISDLAQSAMAISRQQVTLARWAREHLPQDATIGVNDTGALAYMSERTTFDVVGLTTEGEAPYWVAGAGSRFEHYERMPAEKRPTHFVVYPDWMACPSVLGAELTRATVTDQSILGSPTMVAYEADYSLLGSGERPVMRVPEAAQNKLLDRVDIADLESEAEHGYPRLFAFDVDCRAWMKSPPLPWPESPFGSAETEQNDIADGGRFNRLKDAFIARLDPSRPALMIMRIAAEKDMQVRVWAGSQSLGELPISQGHWVERSLEIPADRCAQSTPILVESVTGQGFHSFHYWFYALPSRP